MPAASLEAASDFRFTARAHGVEWRGIGDEFDWRFEPGQLRALRRLSQGKRRGVLLRMRWAHESARVRTDR